MTRPLFSRRRTASTRSPSPASPSRRRRRLRAAGAAAAAAAGAAGSAALRGRRRRLACRRRCRAAGRACVERPSLDARRGHGPARSRSPDRLRARPRGSPGRPRSGWGCSRLFQRIEVLPVLAVVEADADQRVAGLDGVVARLSAVRRRRRAAWPRRSRRWQGWPRRLAAPGARAVADRSSTGARWGVSVQRRRGRRSTRRTQRCRRRAAASIRGIEAG